MWKQCTFLQEQVEDSSQTSFSDTIPSAPSSGTTTPVMSSESEPQKDGSPTCECTRETYGCSTHPNTRDEWIASMRDSLARILAQPENAKELEKVRGRISTLKPLESFAKWNRDTSSWKTCQQSFLEECSQLSWETWPKSGLMRSDGSVYALPTLALTTTGTGGGVWLGTQKAQMNRVHSEAFRKGRLPEPQEVVSIWPSPGAADYKGAAKPSACTQRRVENGQANLCEALMENMRKMWPTPRAGNPGSRPNGKGGKILAEEVKKSVSPTGMPLNPTWVEWLMGWPLGYTALKRLVTGKSRSRQR